MLRVGLDQARSSTAVVAAAMTLTLLSTGTARAQTTTPEPEIGWAPRAVGYDRAARIFGRLEGGSPGQKLQLEKRIAGGDWRRIAARTTDEDNRVRFRVEGLRRSGSYRLVYRDETTGDVRRSDRVRIAVGARLRLHTSRRNVIEGRRVRVYGSLYPKAPERTVVLAQRVAGGWRRIATLAAGDGSFSTYFRPGRRGFRPLRVKFTGDATNRRSVDRRPIRVYEPDLATWYGPGLYGNRTACGQRLHSEMLGVAHRSLPCGTDVSILYQGRTITVPVIDRGPYSSADWDLTEETAERLRFSGKETIGTDR